MPTTHMVCARSVHSAVVQCAECTYDTKIYRWNGFVTHTPNSNPFLNSSLTAEMEITEKNIRRVQFTNLNPSSDYIYIYIYYAYQFRKCSDECRRWR